MHAYYDCEGVIETTARWPEAMAGQGTIVMGQ